MQIRPIDHEIRQACDQVANSGDADAEVLLINGNDNGDDDDTRRRFNATRYDTVMRIA
jgi:hypothetical protein